MRTFKRYGKSWYTQTIWQLQNILNLSLKIHFEHLQNHIFTEFISKPHIVFIINLISSLNVRVGYLTIFSPLQRFLRLNFFPSCTRACTRTWVMVKKVFGQIYPPWVVYMSSGYFEVEPPLNIITYISDKIPNRKIPFKKFFVSGKKGLNIDVRNIDIYATLNDFIIFLLFFRPR